MTLLPQRMMEDMQVRNPAPHTQRAYLQYVSQFARHFRKSPELLGLTEIRAFQLHLARDRKLAAAPKPVIAWGGCAESLRIRAGRPRPPRSCG
jgi:hypothetical protein